MSLTETLRQHFRNPVHVGKLRDADGVGRAENPACGDVVEMSVKLCESRIVAVSFLCQGCSLAIGAASYLCEKIEGLSAEEVLALDANGLMREAGQGDGPIRHAFQLAVRALQVAVQAAVESMRD